MAIAGFITVTRRTVLATLFAGGALVAGLAPAAARWQVHNDADVTQILAPPKGTEEETCTDSLRANSGWQTYVPNSDDVNNYVPPDGSGAYGPVEYDFWRAPRPYTSGFFQESDLNPGQVDFYPDDGSGTSVPAIFVRHYTTPPRTKVSPPQYLYPDQVDPDPTGGNLYLFSMNTWRALLPGLRYGDLVGVKPSGGGSTFVKVTAIHCDATRLHLHFARYNPSGPDTNTDDSLNKETVVIVNGTTQVRQLGGWRLADNDGNVYSFPTTRLDPGQSVTVHTGHGTDSTGQRYWGRSSHVWDNGGDRAVLRNATGTEVDSCQWDGGPGWIYC